MRRFVIFFRQKKSAIALDDFFVLPFNLLIRISKLFLFFPDAYYST